MKNLLQVKVPSAPLRNSYSSNSLLLSECLYGESFNVVEIKDNWVYGHNIIDNYFGWIKRKNLGQQFDHSHKISVPRSVVFSKPDVKSNIIQFLPFSSLIKILDETSDWGSIKINNKIGYISKKHYVSKNFIDKNWVKYAEAMLNTPYHFGGRNSIGLDCSALLQLSIKFLGIQLDRDTKDQILNKALIDAKNSKLKRGSVIFWKDHVAIAVNTQQIIHANAFHMKTCVEDFFDANKRIEKLNGKILSIKTPIDPN